ncbi:hypothetical protein [Alloprevotella tannerae]|uniref:hypothetical protein n=1 Tax=Alloprevotella tannerae TaxID=76122 RepID=UPI0028E48F60|nr:hypothetical protein [Alloprevotella tannerae]
MQRNNFLLYGWFLAHSLKSTIQIARPHSYYPLPDQAVPAYINLSMGGSFKISL